MFDRIDPEKAAQTFFGCSPEDICPVCLLTFSYASCREQVDDVTEFSGWRKGFTGTYKGQKLSVIVPGMGSTAAGDAVVFLGHLNCRVVVYTGAAGGFGECTLGDILVPTKAVVGEGFSQYYTQMKEVFPDESLLETAKRRYSGKRTHFEPIFTIGSIAAQKRDLLANLEHEGIAGIDIETSAIFTASSFCSISCVAVHYISDLPLNRSLLDFFTIDERKSIAQGHKTGMNMALELVHSLSGQHGTLHAL
jgi:purine-nucleoside phosphorylase